MDPITILQKYIAIRTDHPEPDYEKAVNFLKEIANDMGFETQVVRLVDDKVALLVFFRGKNSMLPAILLNSHIDVVKVDEEKWNFDPWSATISDGKMYGRGTQDMKSLGIQQLFACYRLKQQGFEPNRYIILSFVPEEEVMGIQGMNLLINHLPPILFAMDEGIPSPDNTVTIYPGERKTWWLKIQCFGKAGHGSKYLKEEDSATLKLHKVEENIFGFAKIQRDRVLSGELPLGEAITINPNYHSSGHPKFYNVIPSSVELGIDIRIPPHIDLKVFFDTVKSWCSDDKTTKITFQNGTDKDCFENPSSETSEHLNLVKNALDNKNIKYNIRTFPASTDARYLRNAGIPTFGMSVLRNCEVLLHDHDEYIPIESFLEGIDVYMEILKQNI